MRTANHLLEIERFPDAAVARFVHRTILDPEAVEAIGKQLAALVDEVPSRKVVLNFARVESVTSAMLGQFIVLHQQVETAGGHLVFCQVQPFLLQIFTLFNLPDIIPIYGGEKEALQDLP